MALTFDNLLQDEAPARGPLPRTVTADGCNANRCHLLLDSNVRLIHQVFATSSDCQQVAPAWDKCIAPG